MTLQLADLQNALAHSIDRMRAAEAALGKSRRDAMTTISKVEQTLGHRVEQRALASVVDLRGAGEAWSPRLVGTHASRGQSGSPDAR